VFIVYLLQNITLLIVRVLDIAMLVRMLMSWFPVFSDNIFGEFVYFITEPLIMPFRKLLERFEWVQNCPLDIAYFVTFFILSLVSDVLTS